MRIRLSNLIRILFQNKINGVGRKQNLNTASKAGIKIDGGI